MDSKCLIVIDLQNDFCEGGVYAAPNSLSIILKISDISQYFSNIIFTKRCYDKDDKIFEKNGLLKHCIDNTHGSEINFGLIKCHDYPQIKRPYDKSIFCDNITKKNYKLNYILKERKIKDIYFCGLDFMAIFNSIIDAYKYGYKCYLIQDCIPDNNNNDNILFLKAMGVIMIGSIDDLVDDPVIKKKLIF